MLSYIQGQGRSLARKQLWTIAVIVLAIICALAIFHRSLRLILFSLGCLAAYYILIWVIVRKTVAWERLKEATKIEWISIGGICAAGCAVVGYFMSQVRAYPIWDSLAYWSITRNLNLSLDQSISNALSIVYQSINEQDYNSLQSLILSLPIRLFPSWPQSFFITSMCSMPLVAVFIGAYCTVQIESFLSKTVRILPLLVAISFLMPVMMRPTLQGYMDGMSLPLFVAVLLAAIDKSIWKQSPLYYVAFGIGIISTFLLRRWFVFGIIGVAVFACIHAVMMLFIAQQQVRKSMIIGYIRAACIVACAALIPLVTFFMPFLQLSLFGNQSTAYQAWGHFGRLEKYLDVLNSIGAIWFIWALGGLIILVGLFVRRTQTAELLHTRFGVMTILIGGVLSAAVSTYVFWRIQDFSPQHWFMFMPMLQIALIVPIGTTVVVIARPILRNVVTIILVCCVIGNTALAFSSISSNSWISRIFTYARISPMRDENYDIQRQFLDYLYKTVKPNEIVYFAAASAELNSVYPYSYQLMNQLKTPLLTASSDVDMRDGFNPTFFDSSYVVTSSPVSLHMAEHDEQVVVTLNRLVQDRSSFVGRHYVEDSAFTFKDGTKVKLFRLKTPYTKEDVKTMQALFQKLYPNQDQLFNARFEQYLKAKF